MSVILVLCTVPGLCDIVAVSRVFMHVHLVHVCENIHAVSRTPLSSASVSYTIIECISHTSFSGMEAT